MGQLKIYNASAGSGKTYAITREILALLLDRNAAPNTFKQILAITFTNKAAAEMKLRIINTLDVLSKTPEESQMLEDLCVLCRQTPQDLSAKAKETIELVLHGYSSLSISTIDAFSARIIRSFARDLDMPTGFNIILDKKEVLAEAVDMLLARAGRDGENTLTDILLEFTLEETDREGSWGYAKSFEKAAELSVEEKSIEPLKELGKNDLQGYKKLRSKLFAYKNSIEATLKSYGESALAIIENEIGGQQYLSHGKNGIASYFRKASKGEFSQSGRYVLDFVNGDKLTSAAAKGSRELVVDEHATKLIELYNGIEAFRKDRQEIYIFSEFLIGGLRELSLLPELDREIGGIKQRDGSVLLYEFNRTIADVLAGQPAAFIYEKIGARYKHFFIDEFQDTSKLQWQNLLPLIENQLASDGSAMLVGDGKQAVYRFRGGDSELFMQLSSDGGNIASAKKQYVNLDTNYRSSGVLVDFANIFFSLAAESLENGLYKNMYISGSRQKAKRADEKGFVSIELIEGEKKADIDKKYLESVCGEIKRLREEDGYELSDICILVRWNSDGKYLARGLLENGIKVVSAESLLVSSSPEVVFVEAVLKGINEFENRYSRMTILNYLMQNGKIFKASSDVTASQLPLVSQQSPEAFFEKLRELYGSFSLAKFNSLPLYEAVEYIINSFSIGGCGACHLLAFLSLLDSYLKRNTPSLSGFLAWWEQKKKNASIALSESEDAVKIVSIHKAKGLEYPVVILPFADWEYSPSKDNFWVQAPDDELFGALPFAYLSNNKVKELESKGDKHAAEYEKGVLDELNALYVALTRAKKQLHIITLKEKTEQPYHKIIHYFQKFLAGNVNDDKFYAYSMGQRGNSEKPEIKNETLEIRDLHFSDWRQKLRLGLQAPRYWDGSSDAASEKGKVIHSILAEVKHSGELESALASAILQGYISGEQAETIKTKIEKVFADPKTGRLFSDRNMEVYNEREFIGSNGQVLRPDRVCISQNTVWLIDYKSGAPIPEHKRQIDAYCALLSELGYDVKASYLVYLDRDTPLIIEV